MLVAAAVCPHPPLMVPELAGNAAQELDELREACGKAIRALLGAEPDLVAVVGGADRPGRYGADASGTLAPWGADVRVGGGESVLPLSLTIGRWLLEREGFDSPESFHAVAHDADPAVCLDLGQALASGLRRVALLVMGDGSARLTEKSPGYLHPGARPYDDMLAGALAGADVETLAALDPAEAAELWVAGRAAFQVLAGATEEGSAMTGRLLYRAEPYGVSYAVALWETGA
ncbi:class III extradiol dioxygenase subunit B-like domain-containing protein [Sinosporangium album]|nr:class III extradiol dioxygenase subunit B-like domain-containing protein [Sinosporangium album]